MFEDANGNTSQSLTTNLLTLKNNVADPTVTGWNTTYLTQFADKALVKLDKVYFFDPYLTQFADKALIKLDKVYLPPTPLPVTPTPTPNPTHQGLPGPCPGRSQAACHQRLLGPRQPKTRCRHCQRNQEGPK